jgi:hypothetical protein
VSTVFVVINFEVLKKRCPHLCLSAPPFENVQFPFERFEKTFRRGILDCFRSNFKASSIAHSLNSTGLRAIAAGADGLTGKIHYYFFPPIPDILYPMEKHKTRFFNTTDPCNPEDHYMLPPGERLMGTQLHRYIGDKLYWVLHAPQQMGKTTLYRTRNGKKMMVFWIWML